MKKIFAITVLMAIGVVAIAQGNHFDFSATSSTGYEIYYHIINDENHWVEVTYPCQNGDNYWWGYDKPEGALILGDTVTYNGIDYEVVSVGDHAFYGCSGLRGSLVLPQTIRSIGSCAFKGCSLLNGNLSIPAAVTRIDDEAFYGCTGFAGTLALGDSLVFIGNRAFYNCSGLKGELSIPSKVIEIGDSAFEQCSGFNNMVWLPNSLEYIGARAFKGDINIESFNIKRQVPPTTANDAFDDMPVEIDVFVPYNTKEAYQNASGWSHFGDKIVEKSIWSGMAEPWTQGNGTESDPYLIESAENLAWLAEKVNERFSSFNDVKAFQDTCFKLVIDLDLQRNKQYWTPVGGVHEFDGGRYRAYFSGIFDGNNHTVSNYGLRSSGGWFLEDGIDQGLFASVSDAVIINLTVKGVNIYSSRFKNHNGGIAGTAVNTDFYNCHFSGVFTCNSNILQWASFDAAFGGIVGKAQCCRIEKSTSDIDLFATNCFIGGIAGELLCDDSTRLSGIFDCFTKGTFKVWDFENSDPAHVGGIVGSCGNAEGKHGNVHVEHCYSKALIKGVGQTDAIGHIIVPMYQTAGGIVGYSSADTLHVQNCYSNHDINIHETNTTNYAGGIIGGVKEGSAVFVKNCYHVGEMHVFNKGGVLAQKGSLTVIRNCYFDQLVAPDDGFGIPVENDYMKTAAFLNQLNNGSTIFQMDTEPFENDGYPVFGTDGLIFVGAEWYYEIHNADGSVTFQHLQCVGDTVVAEERPKIIVRTNTIYEGKNRRQEVTHEYVYERNGVVYWWNNTLGKFTMLYDFSAEEGDEWTVEVGDRSFTTKVYATEMQYINGIPYKKLTILDPETAFDGELLSSIGHLTSFFPERLMNQGKGYRVDGMRCYWVDGDLILKNGDTDCDEIYDQHHHVVVENDDETFTVHPNPNNGFFTVMGENLKQIEVFDVLGQRITSLTANSDQMIIDLSGQPAGVYLVNIIDQEGKQIVKKVVKQ